MAGFAGGGLLLLAVLTTNLFVWMRRRKDNNKVTMTSPVAGYNGMTTVRQNGGYDHDGAWVSTGSEPKLNFEMRTNSYGMNQKF